MKFTTVFTALVFFLLFSSCEKEKIAVLDQFGHHSDTKEWNSNLALPDNFQDFVQVSFSKSHPFHPTNYNNARIDLSYWDEFEKIDPAPHEIEVEDRLVHLTRTGFQIIAQHRKPLAETTAEEQICPYANCDELLKEATIHYQQLANETNQTIYGGLSCCHPQYGVLHYIILVQPQRLVPPTGPASWTHETE